MVLRDLDHNQSTTVFYTRKCSGVTNYLNYKTELINYIQIKTTIIYINIVEKLLRKTKNIKALNLLRKTASEKILNG